MQTGKSKAWLALTVILALVTTTLMVKYLTSLNKGPAPEPMVTVVVAAKEIHQGTKISEDMLKTTKIPIKYAHVDAITDIEKVKNQVLKTDVFKDETLLKSQVATQANVSELPYKIPDGTRGITIAVTPPSGVAGHVKPGHYVDVLLTYKKPKPDEKAEEEQRSVTLLQKILVLAVGADLNKSEKVQAAENVTLAVNPEGAELIALGENIGKLKLVLRPVTDDKTNPLKAIDRKILQSMYP